MVRFLAHAWHEARVLADEVVSHAFSHGFHPDHSDRLAAYWAVSLGGPRTFSQSIGDEPPPWSACTVGTARTRKWIAEAIACFDQALTDAGFGDDDPVRQVLFDYFAWATTTTMALYHASEDDDALRSGHSPLVLEQRAGRGMRKPRQDVRVAVAVPHSGRRAAT